MTKNKKSFVVGVDEICEDWQVSRAQGYKIIKTLNQQMKKENPNVIIIAGKLNRKFYEENCYGLSRNA